MQYLENLFLYLKNLYTSTNYIHAILIVVLLFLLVLVLAKLRHYLVKSSFKASFVGILLGFLLALIMEGFFLIWGNTLLMEIFGWNNAPKPFKTAIEISRDKFIDVLDNNNQIQSVNNNLNDPKVEDAIEIIQTLDPDENKKIKDIICTP